LIEDETLLASEVVRFEEAILAAAKEKGAAGGQGIIALPGVAKLLAQIGEGAEEERNGVEGWAICTSCESLLLSSFFSVFLGRCWWCWERLSSSFQGFGTMCSLEVIGRKQRAESDLC